MPGSFPNTESIIVFSEVGPIKSFIQFEERLRESVVELNTRVLQSRFAV